MPYRRVTIKSIPTILFIGNNAIDQPETVRDLGVLFDNRMNFSFHKKYVLERAECLYGAAIRFSREINSEKALMRIDTTYINPIMMYASIIWLEDNDRAMFEFECILRKCTRHVSGTPFSNLQMGYRPYEERLAMLHSISMTERILLSWITMAVRICKGETIFELGKRLIERRRDRQQRIRTRNP